MTQLVAFDKERHHVGLGDVDGDAWGLVIAGGYGRNGQTFGSPTDFGGDADLIGLPTLSRWTQDDFTGGAYQATWGKDPAMFGASLNMLPSQYDKSLRTVPPLSRFANFSANGGRVPWLMFAYQGYIFCVFSNGIARFAVGDPTATTLYSFGVGPSFGYADWVKWAEVDRNSGELLISWDNGLTGVGHANAIERFQLPGMTRPAVRPSVAPPVDKFIDRFAVQGGVIIAQCGLSVYTTQIPEDGTTPVWVEHGHLGGQWINHVQWNGGLYILCYNDDVGTSLVMYDPKVGAVLPVADFPYNFRGRSVAQYAGRLYVGGSHSDIQGNERNAVMYEVSAAAVRMVRTWTPQASQPGYHPSKPKTIAHWGVHEGLLFFGEWGRGLVAYDVTGDAFHGASMMNTPDGVTELHNIISTHERLYVWAKHPTDPTQDGIYRVTIPSDVTEGDIASYEGIMVTSDFGPEIDRRKRWSAIRVATRFGGCSIEYSMNGGYPGGDTFIPVPSTQTQDGLDYLTTADLSGIPVSHKIKFRVRLPRGTDVTTYSELIGYTVAFTFLDTGKWSWQLNVDGTVRVERAGDIAETEIQDVHDVGTELRRFWREQTPLRYIDLDGTEYTVVLKQYRETQPVIGQPVEVYGADGAPSVGREAYYSLSLLEV